MTASLRKLIDVIRNLGDEEKPAISLEYFPPRSEEGVAVRITWKSDASCVHVIVEAHSAILTLLPFIPVEFKIARETHEGGGASALL